MEQFKIEKVPLRTILEGLTELYNAGYEFFDLTAIITQDGKRDEVNISILPSYKIPLENDDQEELDYEDLI